MTIVFTILVIIFCILLWIFLSPLFITLGDFILDIENEIRKNIKDNNEKTEREK